MKPWIQNTNLEGALLFNPQVNKYAPLTVCISITTTDKQVYLPKMYRVLSLFFCDIDADRYPNWLEQYRKSIDEGNEPFSSKEFKLFDEEDAKESHKFVDEYRACNFLIQCEAGISRSAAIAEALLEYLRESHIDAGGFRHPNNFIKRILKRELGLVPIGV